MTYAFLVFHSSSIPAAYKSEMILLVRWGLHGRSGNRALSGPHCTRCPNIRTTGPGLYWNVTTSLSFCASVMEPRHSLCLWKSCTVSFEGSEDLFAHLCDVHGGDVSCERKHRFACEWQECDTLVVCTGSRHATRLLCAAKNHLLQHAEFRPAPYTDTSPPTFKPSAPTSAPTPGPPVPRLRPSRPLIDMPAVPTSSPSTSRANPKPLPRNADAHGLPSPSPSTSSAALLSPPPMTLSCRWSSCSESATTFTDGQTLLGHILNAHIRRPATRDPSYELIRSLTKDGIEKTYSRVQCAWTRTNGLPCHTKVAVRGKYATHYKEHIIALAKDVGVECTFKLKTQITVPPKKRPRGRPPKNRDVADSTKTKTKRARPEDEFVPRVVYVSLSPWQPEPVKLEPSPTPAVEPSSEEDLGMDVDMDMDWSLS
ncbi:hypothetical protein EXIGLDRAFT_844236 [Exidia glandulosa HHB12029]|uniref:C2H2-type domain-containing protein n=1 Tax=Exidia glandulosa HHB12029 TaxID=1314781 RepID=A0A165C5F2_EXIGL|nr:hypothetical protein EXIGLDRAFT_844236 [Exidia glandulosa HHB12029]